MTVELANSLYRVQVAPDHGGAVLTAKWFSAEGHAIDLLVPPDPSLPPFKTGCFAMIPFANRIAGAAFTSNESSYRLPVNDPVGGMAIHGFSRDRPWEVAEKAKNALSLAQDFSASDNPYRYHARQRIDLSDTGIRIAVAIRNDGDRAMPFGLGLHPWFPKTERATLSFAAKGTFVRDGGGLPKLPLQVVAAFQTTGPEPLETLPWFDGCFAYWEPRQARLDIPEIGLAIDIEADGALRHLHVFVPDNRPVVCVEPVSHAPDAVNRPELGEDHAMKVLSPGETLEGALTFRAVPYPAEAS